MEFDLEKIVWSPETIIAVRYAGVQLAERLSTIPIAAIYSSDLRRTMQTAHAVASKLHASKVNLTIACNPLCFACKTCVQAYACFVQIIPVTQLRERHLGVLEGLTRSQAAAQHPHDFANLSGLPDAKPEVPFLSEMLLASDCMSVSHDSAKSDCGPCSVRSPVSRVPWKFCG